MFKIGFFFALFYWSYYLVFLANFRFLFTSFLNFANFSVCKSFLSSYSNREAATTENMVELCETTGWTICSETLYFVDCESTD